MCFQESRQYLREEVVEHMGTNVVVNFVEDAIVSVNSRQTASQVAPLLQNI